MKKNYLLMAAAATMLAACSQSDFVNEIPESAPQAIGFKTVANKTTRADETAENSSAKYTWSLADHHDAFTVWGHKLVGTDGINVFNGVKVSYSEGAWSYVADGVNLVYWDKGATSYDFYAAAPVKADFWTLNNNSTPNTIGDDYITTASFTVQPHNAATYLESTDENKTKSFHEVEKAEDLMIAAPANVVVAGSDLAQPVQLNFIHLLSRLNVEVTTSLDGVVIKNITVGNLNSTGEFNETGKFDPNDETDTPVDATTLAAGTYERWKLTTGLVNYIAAGGENGVGLSKDQTLIAIEALVMPQLAAVQEVALSETSFTDKAPYLYVEYTLNGQAYRRAYNLANTFNAENGLALNEGWQYTLSLSIGATAIKFTANVAEWADGAPSGSQQIN